MPAYPTFSTRVIGQAEKTLNAILGRELAGTGQFSGRGLSPTWRT